MQLLAIIILIVMFVIIVGGVIWLGKVANEFFREADRIEGLIETSDDIKATYKALAELSTKSFHRQTAFRVNELRYMFYRKYPQFKKSEDK